MIERPSLSKEMEYDEFVQYYYLKEELIAFCRENGIPTVGSKKELNERVGCFLRTGEILRPVVSRKPIKGGHGTLSLESAIEKDFVCSEDHRAFFRSEIGDSFSFNVTFQRYLKDNPGKTYSEAIDEWYRIDADRKRNKGKSIIGDQFEYNTYIRDFFNDNKGLTLKDAIECWKFKKGSSGHNRYERQDLVALKR